MWEFSKKQSLSPEGDQDEAETIFIGQNMAKGDGLCKPVNNTW